MCSLSKAKLSITCSVLFCSTHFNTLMKRLRKKKNTNNWIPSNALQSALRLNQVIKSNDKMKHVARMITMNCGARLGVELLQGIGHRCMTPQSEFAFLEKKKATENTQIPQGISYRMQKRLLRRVFIVRIIEVRPKVIVYYRHWYAVYTSAFKDLR